MADEPDNVAPVMLRRIDAKSRPCGGVTALNATSAGRLAQSPAQGEAIKCKWIVAAPGFCVNPRLEKQAFPCHGQYFIDAPIMRLHSDG